MGHGRVRIHTLVQPSAKSEDHAQIGDEAMTTTGLYLPIALGITATLGALGCSPSMPPSPNDSGVDVVDVSDVDARSSMRDALAPLDGMDREESSTTADVASDRSRDSTPPSDANGGSCSAGTVPPSVVASRTTCAAPCAVFFDATGTTGLSGGDYVGANWTWDFDDPSSPHPRTIGFNVAHVFDNPGTYAVNAHVQDLVGNQGCTTTTITVSAMSGTTYYVSSSGSDSNSGVSMSAPFLTLAHALSVGAATNNSILLRRGDTFTIGSLEVEVTTTGPFLIGAYTDPLAPSSSAPVLSSSSPGGIIGVNGTDDRFTDLHIVSTASAGGGIVESTGGGNVLNERVEIEGIGSGSNITASTNLGPYFFDVDCNFHDSGGYGYIGTEPTGVSVIGTTFANFTATDNHHMIRIQGREIGSSDPQTNSIYIADNTITPILPSVTDGFNSVTVRGDSMNMVLVNNYLTAPMLLQNGQQGLVEGNTFINQFGALTLEINHAYIRNNLFTGLPDGGPQAGIVVTTAPARATNWVDEIFVYNNTQYVYHACSYSNATQFVGHQTTTGHLTVANNILSTGNQSLYSQVMGADGAGTETINNNLIYAPNAGGSLTNPNVGAGGVVQRDPTFVSTDLTNPTAFQLPSGSPAINAGMMVPVYRDFIGTPRPQGPEWDIGAFEFPSQ